MLDLAFRLQVFQSAELFFGRNFRINSMQLIKSNLLEPQPAKTSFASGSEMLGPSVLDPSVRTRPLVSAFSRNHQFRWVRVQGLGNNPFTHFRTVGICGINEIDSQFDGLPQHTYGFGTICGLTPNSLACDAHSAIPQPGHTEIISDQELTGLLRRTLLLSLCRCAVRHVDFLPSNVDAPIAAPVSLSLKQPTGTVCCKIT